MVNGVAEYKYGTGLVGKAILETSGNQDSHPKAVLADKRSVSAEE